MAQQTVTETSGLTHSDVITAYNANATDAESRLAASESHAADTMNPHSVTKAHVGLGNCDNTSDADKPLSTAQAASITTKQATLVSGTNIKTINGVSLLGSGDISISAGAWPAIDGTLQTGNFNFGSTSRIVPISLAVGNIIGTFPAIPFDGQICGVVAQGISGGSANRFTLGLNSRTRDGAGSATVTRTTGFETEAHNSSNGVPSLVTELGMASYVKQSGNFFVSNGAARTGSRGALFYGGTNHTLTTPNLPTGGVLTYWHRNGAGHTEIVNGTSQAVPTGFSWVQRSISLPAGASTIVINSSGFLDADDFLLSGISATPPAAWTDVASIDVGPGGAAVWQWSSASQTWHTLFRRQLG